MEKLSAVIERVTFYGEDTGFSVLQARSLGARSSRVTIIGNLPPVSPGETVEASGEWRTDPKHGVQFQAESVSIRVPTTRSGIERLLASGLLKGVGPSTAKLIVQRFGESTLDVIDEDPARLTQVVGIGPKRAGSIAKSWKEARGLRDLMLFLQEHGVGPARIRRIWNQYGANAVAEIKNNPYRLADDVRGIGFKSADAIALSLGFERSSIFRARAGLSHVLSEAMSQGHCGLPREDLVEKSVSLLEIEPGRVTEALEMELGENHLAQELVEDGTMIYLPWLYRAEERIAATLISLAGASTRPWPEIDAEAAMGWVERRNAIVLSPSQRQAITQVLASRVAVITGGPGVGKTTLVNSILRILTAKAVDVALAAPTGRAARRLADSTGFSARTIHRLLEINPRTGRFTRNETRPIEADLLVVDEVSMVDVPLMDSLVRALPSHAALLLVGDVDQLPSVGPGKVLEDVIESGRVPAVRLTEIFRQKETSSIIVGAHEINRGRMPEFDTADSEASDFFFVETEPEAIAEMVRRLVSDRIPRRFGLDPLRDIQVLTPMNRGGSGVEALNSVLQRSLNERSGKEGIERYGSRYTTGDKIMQTENDYDKEVFNGDIGVIRRIDDEEEELVAEFEGRSVRYGFDEIDRLVLAYASTIHKSQGSEYPAVIVPLSMQHYVMLQRNLIYTAVTRGKRLVVLVGQKEALRRAISRRVSNRRWTRLQRLLKKSEE